MRGTGRRKSRGGVTALRLVAFAGLLTFSAGLTYTLWSPELALPHVAVSTNLAETAVRDWSGCLREAAGEAGVDPVLLRAIVLVESGEHPYAFGWFDAQGLRRTIRPTTYAAAVAQFSALERQHVRFDVGLAQVNSRNLAILEARTGIPPVRALDACTNLRLAGIILGEQIRLHGNTWRAVAGYNGSLAYVPKVHRWYCTELPEARSCGRTMRLSELLCEPLPIGQTERYYRVFARLR